jgi:hypothetical protein
VEDHPLLRLDREVRLPLLTTFNSSDPGEIANLEAAVLLFNFRILDDEFFCRSGVEVISYSASSVGWLPLKASS